MYFMNLGLLQAITGRSFEDEIVKKKEGICKDYQSMLNKFEKFCIRTLDDHIESIVDNLYLRVDDFIYQKDIKKIIS